MTIRYGSRRVTVPDISLRDVEDSDALHPISRSELAERAYRRGVMVALQAIDGTAGARAEYAYLGDGGRELP